MGRNFNFIGTMSIALVLFGPAASAATIRTVSATYGNLEAQRICDATPVVANLCNGRARCVVGVRNGNLCGDPDFLTVKKARIEYSCGRLQARSVIIDEYASATLACE